jgi:XTP/dITP diphosphohydrolase
MVQLLLATGNGGKIAELRALLSAQTELAGITLVTAHALSLPMPDVEETGATFSENARLKALAWARASGLPALADDSGLCVDALGGDPGIRSARWAGPTDADRNAALLHRLKGIVEAARTAQFVCAVCAALPDGTLAEAESFCRGRITDAPRGTEGFGYDPLFFVTETGRTMAELSAQEKNRNSHRAHAFRRLSPKLARLLGTL